MAKAVKVVDVATGSSKLTSGGGMATVSGAGVTLVDTNTTQTFTNKTLTSPTIEAATSANGTFDLATITNATVNLATTTNTTVGVKFESLAGTGSSISDAAAINAASSAVLVTGANAAVGVKLPVAAAGKIIYVKNSDAANAVLCVYPQVNSTINALSANATFNMAANTACTFLGTSATNWVSIPRAAS